MPEMKDRSSEEIDELFIKGVPARKFKKYRTVGIEHMHDDEVYSGKQESMPIVTTTEDTREVR